MRLDDTVAIITGASAGLGAEMARGFVDEGATVVCAARSEDRLRSKVDELNERGTASAVTADVRSWSDVQRLVSRTVELSLVVHSGLTAQLLIRSSEKQVNQ